MVTFVINIIMTIAMQIQLFLINKFLAALVALVFKIIYILLKGRTVVLFNGIVAHERQNEIN